MKVIWYFVFSFLFFYLEPMVKKERLDQNDIRHYYQKCRSKSYLITAMLKVSSQQLQSTLTKTLERHSTVKNFTKWINIHANSFLVKHHEIKIDEDALKIMG